MAAQPRQPEVGPAGRNLAAHVDRLCRERGWSWNRLSAEMGNAGRPVPPLGLSRMLQAGRRTDVDELLAFADVLGTTPTALLAPPGTAVPDRDHPAVRAVVSLAGHIGQLLATPGDPADREDGAGYVDRALRRVQVEVEELLAEAATTATPGVSPNMHPRRIPPAPASSGPG
jgi:hypothetical protein